MDIALLCREHAPEAIERLLYLLRSDDNRAVAFAIQTMLDRGFGRAVQVIEGGGDSIQLLHLLAAQKVSITLHQDDLESGPVPSPPDEHDSVTIDGDLSDSQRLAEFPRPLE
jgi:hypothetical protein